MAEPHRCTAGCGRVITYRFAICASCEEIYGNKATEWPEWLRFSWNNIQRMRRQKKRIIAHEVFSGLSDEVMFYAE